MNKKKKRRTLTIICLYICSKEEEQDLVRTTVLFSVVRAMALLLVDVAEIFIENTSNQYFSHAEKEERAGEKTTNVDDDEKD